jgi:hypothetical protein
VNPEREAIRSALVDVVQLRLENFTGLVPGTTKADIVETIGPIYSEGFGGGVYSLWMTVHEIDAMGRLTAWYLLDEDAVEVGIRPDHPVTWIQRPVIPTDVTVLQELSGSYRPPGKDYLKVWPERGLCLRYSRRSWLPTLLFAFPPMSPAEFNQSPMVTFN